jgi:hypothetical protein
MAVVGRLDGGKWLDLRFKSQLSMSGRRIRAACQGVERAWDVLVTGSQGRIKPSKQTVEGEAAKQQRRGQ